MKDSTMGIESAGESYHTGNYYYSLTVGGFIGYSGPGSSNAAGTEGKEGVAIKDCSFTSNNTTQKEVLYAKEVSGGAPNVGGIMGVTYNNASIINTNINITKGTMIAERTTEDYIDTRGSTCGGVVGRLEHTGLIKGCTVTGNNLNIIAKSTKREMYAGGIVGVDLGPWHRNVISLENNSFVGNGTSNITVELVKGSLENRHIYAGGIAGATTYIMKNCSVSGVTISNKGSDTGVLNTAVGKLAGRFELNTGLWKDNGYFTPNETRGIIDCTTDNVSIVIDDNNSGVVLQGEQYGTDV